jgi:hypothetical protein
MIYQPAIAQQGPANGNAYHYRSSLAALSPLDPHQPAFYIHVTPIQVNCFLAARATIGHEHSKGFVSWVITRA